MSRILIYHDTRIFNTDMSKSFLNEKFPDEKIIVSNNRNEVLDNILDTEIFVSFFYDKEVIEKGKNIKWIQTLAAGYNNFDIQYLKSRNIKLSRTVDAHNIHIAEFSIMAMIMLAREMNIMAKGQFNSHWQKELNQERIYEKTLLLLGYGAIGH